MNPESRPMSWKIFLSGDVPDYLYELQKIDTTKPCSRYKSRFFPVHT
jgi:hypothetical protein